MARREFRATMRAVTQTAPAVLAEEGLRQETFIRDLPDVWQTPGSEHGFLVVAQSAAPDAEQLPLWEASAQALEPYTFVLVRAGAEGLIGEICLAHGTTLAALHTVIGTAWEAAMATCDGPYARQTQQALAEERTALLAMLARHPHCLPGRYVLSPIAPVWERCTLIITTHDAVWFP